MPTISVWVRDHLHDAEHLTHATQGMKTNFFAEFESLSWLCATRGMDQDVLFPLSSLLFSLKKGFHIAYLVVLSVFFEEPDDFLNVCFVLLPLPFQHGF